MAVAKAFKDLSPSAEVLFVGAGRPMEKAILDPAGWPRVELTAKGFKGGSLKIKIGAVKASLIGFVEALKVVKKFRPNVFFGAGGYVTGPVGLAAWLFLRPVAIHEQNSRPGLANRMLAKIAKEIFVGFPEGLEAFPSDKAILTGNPLRPEIAALYERKLNYEKDAPFVLLVMGGSQGANRLNLATMELVAEMAKARLNFEIVHQTGIDDEGVLRSFYNRLGVKHETKAFFSDPERLYQKAHLGITRAGALTVTELAAAGLPAILVPLKTAADDHQTLNARALSEAGAGIVMTEEELPGLFSRVKSFMDNPLKLNGMSGRGRYLVNLRAASQMAGRLLALAKSRARG
jgi:UDP-N-acetylglucosamine--N-acetylmuramyl-(pentapeptide) pyrophosphoryl-undecaprenol N-acetylglucosamine transferase